MRNQFVMALKIEVVLYTTGILFFISYVESFQKQWTKTNSWNEPSNWDPPRLPCPNDNIILKDDIIYIEQNVTLKAGLSLPSDGEIIFGPNANLVFGEITERTRREISVSDCVDDSGAGQQVSFVGQHEKQWLNPNNWEVYKEGKKDEYMSKAIPYIERVPCLHDGVSFPKGNAFEIDIANNITVKDIAINGEVITNDTELQSYLLTKEGKARFKFLPPHGLLNLDSTPCGKSVCMCGNEILREEICRTFTCPATCKRRVKPHNDCCYHCGALIDVTYYGNFDLHECSMELRALLNGESKYASVRLYMSDIQSKIQILVSEDHDGSYAESAADSIQIYINNNSSQACGGSDGTKPIVIVHKGKSEKDEEETSRGTVALAIILPIILVAIIIIAGAYFHRKRSPRIKTQRFNNDDFNQYPGVNDVEMTTEFTGVEFHPSGMAFENPTYNDTDQQDGNVMKSMDTVSPEYAIPLQFLSTKRMEKTHKPIKDPEVPRYVELALPDKAVGVSNVMFDVDHTSEGHPNPLYTENEFREKLAVDASEGDLESADDNMDSIKLKLELKLKDPSDSEDDIVDTPYEETGPGKTIPCVTETKLEWTLENPSDSEDGIMDVSYEEVGPGKPPVYEKTTPEPKLEWKLKDPSDSCDGAVDSPYDYEEVEEVGKGWVTDFDS